MAFRFAAMGLRLSAVELVVDRTVLEAGMVVPLGQDAGKAFAVGCALVHDGGRDASLG
ncbi:MAG: hypothetical protein BWY17_05164 [Deltaproteobacteria bacterium ADurb.Bin207]|nr:MAG: hypothetical protein BWY17_05164 [Deltaproteobacteria bacterium ADurb.Bin207]